MSVDALKDNAFSAISRRGLLKASLAASAFATVGASSSAFAASDAPKKGGHLKLGLSGGASTDTLDPAGYISAHQMVLARSWGDTLVETHPQTGKPLPSLAESWDSKENSTVWTFKIRKGVQFHDGSTLTAEDVVMTLRRHSDKASKSGALGYLTSLKDVSSSGDDVVITLTEGNVDLPLILSIHNLVIQPKGGTVNANAGIGTGPYKIASNDPGVRILLEKNKNDWNSNRGWSIASKSSPCRTCRQERRRSLPVRFISSMR